MLRTKDGQRLYATVLAVGAGRRRRCRPGILDFEQAIPFNKLKTKIGAADGIEGVATWKTQLSLRFDQARLKEEEPDLFQRYQSETKQRAFRLQ